MPKLSLGKPAELIVDTGNPLMDRTIDGFFKIGTVAATRAAAEDAFFMAQKGSVSRKSIESSVKKMCKEGAYWGAISGVYVGMEYGVRRIRGSNDYQNAMIGGALTGALVSAVSNGDRDKIFLDALVGGAVATAAEFINYLK